MNTVVQYCGCTSASATSTVKCAGSKAKSVFQMPILATAAVKYQDVRYGSGMRVMNLLRSKGHEGDARCTVCQAVRRA